MFMSHRLVLIVEDAQHLAANLEIACAAISNVEVKVAMGAEQAWTILGQVRPGDPLVIVTGSILSSGSAGTVCWLAHP
jgi:hypothetical protein